MKHPNRIKARSTRWIGAAACLALAASATNAQTKVFEDTFDVSSSTPEQNLNADLSARQSGSIVDANGTFSYTVDEPSSGDASIIQLASDASDDGVNVVEGASVETPGSFASDAGNELAGGVYDIDLTATAKSGSNNEWLALTWSETQDSSITGGNTDLGLLLRQQNASNDSTVFVDGNSVGSFSLGGETSSVRVRVDETSNNFDLFVDGESMATVSGNISDFDNSDRHFTIMAFGSQMATDTTIDNVSLTAIPEPETAALGLGLSALAVVSLVRFRRARRG